jgi:hypothetical protein
MTQKTYIIVHDTLCGDGYEWTQDKDGKDVIFQYATKEEAEKEMQDTLQTLNEGRDVEDQYSSDEFAVIEYANQEATL